MNEEENTIDCPECSSKLLDDVYKGYLAVSFDSVISKPAAVAASDSSLNDGSFTQFTLSSRLPAFLESILLK